MARAPVQMPQLTEALRPVASPVDSFVQAPQVVQDNRLMDFARGLSKLDAGLSGFIDQRKKEQDEEDAIKGEALFHSNNREGFAEAVAAGRIPAYASKAFVEGYKRSQGNIAGYDMEQRFKAAYDAWPGKTSQNPADFDNFLSGFVKENLKTDDPAVLRGVLPRLRALTESASATYSRDRSKALMASNENATAAEGSIALEEEHRRGLVSRKGTDYGAAFGKIEAIRAAKIGEGLPEEKVDQLLVDTLTAEAIKRRDPDLLKFLDRKVPGKEHSWADTPYGRDQKAKTIETLEGMGRKAIAEEARLQKEADKRAYEDVTRRAVTSLAANPDAPFPEEMLKEGEKYDGEFRIKVNNWRENIRKNLGSSSPQALMELNRELIEGGGNNAMAIIQRGMENGVIANKEDLVSAYRLAEDLQKNGKRYEAIRGSEAAKTIRGVISRRSQVVDFNNPFAPEGMSDTGLAASYDFDRLLMEWALKNPNASADEQEKAIGSIGATILGRMGQEGGGTGAATYDRSGLPGDNPHARGSAPPASPQPESILTPPGSAGSAPRQTPRQAPQPAQGAPDATKVQEWFRGLPEPAREAARQRAQSTGRTLSDVVIEGYRRAQQPAAQPEATVKPMSYAPDEGEAETAAPIAAALSEADTTSIARQLSEALDVEVSPQDLDRVRGLFEQALSGTGPASRNFTVASLNDDPKAARILDFISGPESTGNYNAVFRNARATEDLSQFSLDQILQRQAADRRRGAKSTAIGRYQFIYKTLAGLKDELGLSGSERFTPELQDRMAIQLLRRRGYDRWVSGRMSTNTFANNLAKEWASLPNLQTGRSHYAGDGLNASHVTPAAVLQTLSGASALETPEAQPPAQRQGGRFGPGDVYANIPEKDGRGDDQIAKFMRWNPDPIGNHEKNLKTVKPTLQSVVQKAIKDNPGLRIVVGSGVRDAELQKEAVKWGWSKTQDSNHIHGDAVDLWVLDDKGRVTFDPELQGKMGAAMKKAAKELGIPLGWGGDWKSFKDRPHFELLGGREV